MAAWITRPVTAKASFDQVPRSIARDPSFREMPELECKMILLLASRRQWRGSNVNAYPLTTIEELSHMIGARFKRTSKALHDLAARGAVTVEKRGRSLRIVLCFTPFQPTGTNSRGVDTHLNVNRCSTTEEEPGQMGRQQGRRESQKGRPDPCDVEAEPAWVTESESQDGSEIAFQ